MATSDGFGTISADEVKQRKLYYAGNAVQYSSAMGTAVTHRYDGQDRPGSRDIEFSRPGAAQKKRLDRKTAAIIHLHNAGEYGFSYGTLNSVGVKAPCHVAYHASSQTPGIQLHVNMDAERTIVAHIFCQALHRSVQADRSTVKLSFKMRYGNDLALEEEIPVHNPELMEHAGDKTLLELRFRIWGTDTRPYDLPGGPTPGPVIFTGISAHELKDLQIRCCTDGAAKNDAEMLIAWLSCCPEDLEISVYRYWFPEGAVQARAWSDWFISSMTMSANFGSHWFYRMQEQAIGGGRKIHDPEFALAQLDPPRWLATEFLGPVRSHGDVLELSSISKWESFNNGIAPLLYAQPQDLAFEIRLGLERDRPHRSNHDPSLMISAIGQIAAQAERPHAVSGDAAKPNSGVDIASLVLRSPPTIPNPSCFSQRIGEQQWAIIGDIAAQYGLDSAQRECLTSALSS